MSESEATAGNADSSIGSSESVSESAPQWGANAPRGAKTVLNRIVKEGASVPLFLGQTLVNSLRDTGYNNTTSAICEHVDNSVESGASEIRIYFIESGRKERKTFNVLVLDNGIGMTPNVLKAACAFGGSMRFDNRDGIGRYGMGMKAAALSISPVLDVYSWQEPGAYYNVTLDVEAIGQDKANVIYVPEPNLLDMLPTEIVLALNSTMVYPKNPTETQELFCRDASELRERLGESGTVVYMPNCDRLTYRKVSSLVDHATKEMSRVYRRQLEKGLKLFINNRLKDHAEQTIMPSCQERICDASIEAEDRDFWVNFKQNMNATNFAILNRLANGELCSEIALDFGVSAAAIRTKACRAREIARNLAA